MLRTVAWILTVFRLPAFRRVLAAMIVIGLATAPFLNALSAGHADEIGSALAGVTTGFSDPGGLVPDVVVAKSPVDQGSAAGKVKSPGDKSPGDHSCHGCSIVFLADVASTRFDRVVNAARSIEPTLILGRIVPADLRPPRA